MTADLALIWPELILTIGGLVTLLLGTFGGDRQVGLYQLAALVTLAAAAAAVVAMFGTQASVFSNTLEVDAFGGFAKLLIYAASFICILIAPRFFKDAMRAEYPVLILFAALGMGIMASARDLMTLYVGLELNSLAAYVLASFMRSDDRSSEAGLKCLLTLEAWSAEGRREVEAVADAVRGLLDDAELSLPGHRLVSLRHRRTVSRREAKTGFFVAEMSFRAVVE